MVQIEEMPVFATKGGDVLRAVKSSDVAFTGFGEAYFSEIELGAVKGWKRHTQMVMNIVVPVGRVKFVFFREGDREFKEVFLGRNLYGRVTVPSGIWFAFQGLAEGTSLILNVASIEHDPLECEHRPLESLDYQCVLEL